MTNIDTRVDAILSRLADPVAMYERLGRRATYINVTDDPDGALCLFAAMHLEIEGTLPPSEWEPVDLIAWADPDDSPTLSLARVEAATEKMLDAGLFPPGTQLKYDRTISMARLAVTV